MLARIVEAQAALKDGETYSAMRLRSLSFLFQLLFGLDVVIGRKDELIVIEYQLDVDSIAGVNLSDMLETVLDERDEE